MTPSSGLRLRNAWWPAVGILCSFPVSLPTQRLPDGGLSSEAELTFLRGIHLDAPFAARRDSPPPEGVAHGRALFHDRKFSAKGDTSCADCHRASAAFSSPRTVEARGVPSLYGAGAWRFLNADGSADSLLAQAWGPLTHPQEMGLNCTSPQGEAEKVTPRCKEFLVAVSAYVATLALPPPAPIDVFAQAVRSGTLSTLEPVLAPNALRGLRAFVTTAQCSRCHFGPYLSDGEFHNVGVPATPDEKPERAAGRAHGLVRLAKNPFRCEECDEWKRLPHGLGFTVGAFKTPPLRELLRTPPYMHNGVYQSLAAAVEHYAQAPEAVVGTSEAPRGPRGQALFSTETRDDLRAFLVSLSSVGGNDPR